MDGWIDALKNQVYGVYSRHFFITLLRKHFT
jgi:hypothetical protein